VHCRSCREARARAYRTNASVGEGSD
jgi:hypothetical protein